MVTTTLKGLATIGQCPEFENIKTYLSLYELEQMTIISEKETGYPLHKLFSSVGLKEDAISYINGWVGTVYYGTLMSYQGINCVRVHLYKDNDNVIIFNYKYNELFNQLVGKLA